ncbi:MAG: T9SS type A sorting domain-containing protein [Bacteroidetes bacterium]|nr:T9SS type A sorting domain-containing protein [Bacteroidota bacterium]
MLSPAPAKDYLRVSTNEVLKMAVQFEIQDPNGKLVKSKKAKKTKGNFDVEIDISDLPDGIYFLKIYVENTEYVQRFVKGE